MIHPSGKARTCHYCGLPAGVSKATEDTEVFCCFGCRFASAVAQENGAEGQMRWTLTRLGLAIFFSMNVMVFTLVLWSRDVYVAEVAQSAARQSLDELLRYMCLIFSIPVLFLLGGALWDSAWSELRNARIGSDLLLITGVVAAFGYSGFSLVTGGRHIYFEVGCMVLVVVTLGRWLEATGKLKTTESLHQLAALLPTVVQVLRGDRQEEIPIEKVVIGDHLRVLPGQRIPTDGKLLESSALIDEQMITGEFEPSVKQPGEQVFGGTLNLDSDLTMEVSSPSSEGTIQRVVDAVSRAAAVQGRWQRLADRISRVFLPIVIVIALATFVVHTYRTDFQQGMLASLAVVLIACPCALGLATPMAVWVALGRASTAGVLFQDGDALARLANIRVAAFDKTGTLTSGSPEVDKMITDGETAREEVVAVTKSMTGATTHRLALAVQKFLSKEKSNHSSRPTIVETLPGRGLIGTLAGDLGSICLGSMRLMHERNFVVPQALQKKMNDSTKPGQPLVALGYRGCVRAVFVLRETLRPEATEVLQWTWRQRLKAVLLTGDRQGASSVAQQLGDLEVRAGLLPEEKLEAIAQLRSEYGPVMMIGDGVNDAPALTAADAGVALGCGADVARDSADVCLLGSDLSQIPWAYELAQQAVRTIRQNLFWAFGYNTLGIGLAAMGWLNPILAALAMIASSILVISNSLKLASFSQHSHDFPKAESKQATRAPSAKNPSPLLSGSYSGGISG